MGDTTEQDMTSRPLEVLVVEDESIVALYLKKKLQSLGYHPLAVVTNGRDALDEADRKKPDLALMDINLEGDMDGIQTAEKLIERYNIPIVYITAYSDEETLQRAKNTDPYGYLIKPFESGDIKVTVEIAMHKHRLDQELKEREERFRLLAENTRDVVGLLDEEGNFRYVSPSVEWISGYAPDEIIGKHFYFFLSESDQEKYEDRPFAELVTELNGDPLVTRQKTKDGDVAWVESLLEPIHDEKGQLQGFQSSERMISERVEAQEKLAEANRALEQRNKELRELSARLQNLQEEERKHLSREIHDGLGQELIGLKMQLSWIKNMYAEVDEEAADSLGDAVQSVQDMISNVRNLAKTLRPVLLDKMGLHEAVKYEVQSLRQHADFDVELKICESFPPLPNDIAVAAFRIYQEATTNIAKHAEANQVYIELAVENDWLNVVVEDDGMGISSQDDDTFRDIGSGMLSMRERAENLGGSFTLSSSEQGTKIEARLPISI
jgi:PAS domain S-box-containing protein